MKFVLSFLFFVLFLEASAKQNKAFLDTDQKNRIGSDASLKQSTGYAMNALMDLSNLNISSAMKNGVNAYGKYQNSETLDKLSNQNMFYSAGLTSAGDKTPDLIPVMTTYRRLDPKFLREGQLGKIAADFEKKSGMKREQFLLKMSDASENKIQRSDPNLVSKVLGRFESFVSSLPNAQFRSNIKKATTMVPQKTVAEIIQKTVKQYSSSSTGTDEMASSADTMKASLTTSTASSKSGVISSSSSSKVRKHPSTQDRKIASEEISNINSALTGNIGLNANNQAEDDDLGAQNTQAVLRSALKAAKDAQEKEPTIFEQVHARYRSLTPGIQGLSP